MFMDKKLKAYIKEAEELAKKPSKEKRDYHFMMLETFKHERVVHLFVTLALTVTVVLYARHYYLLENGCQKLEEISKKFYDIKD